MWVGTTTFLAIYQLPEKEPSFMVKHEMIAADALRISRTISIKRLRLKAVYQWSYLQKLRSFTTRGTTVISRRYFMFYISHSASWRWSSFSSVSHNFAFMCNMLSKLNAKFNLLISPQIKEMLWREIIIF